MWPTQFSWRVVFPVLLVTPLVWAGLTWTLATLAPRHKMTARVAAVPRPSDETSLAPDRPDGVANPPLVEPSSPSTPPPFSSHPFRTPPPLPVPPGDGKARQPQEPAPPARSDLPPELHVRVDRAVERGLFYLSKQQSDDGSWSPSDYTLAMTALGGLTLLESGVPRDDQRVQRAARSIREQALRNHQSTHTYTVSLVILFLDALQAAEDRPLLRTLALRLIAGQQADGGWSYQVPKLSETDERQLFHALTQVRPPELAQLIRILEESRPLERLTSKPGAAEPAKPLERLTQGATVSPLPEDATKAVALLPEPLRQLPGLREVSSGKSAALTELGLLDRRPPEKRLREKNAEKSKDKAKAAKKLPINYTDNSNTQFAILALWAALRHGVPAEHA
ncbi:MAG: hypothetical protein SNJ75_03665, partial [Gemmataceae bacterium]